MSTFETFISLCKFQLPTWKLSEACVHFEFWKPPTFDTFIIDIDWGESKSAKKMVRGYRASVEEKNFGTDESGERPGTSCWSCTPCNINLCWDKTVKSLVRTTSREGYPKHLGSSDGSGESSAISASSTILPTSPDSQAHDTEDITNPPSLESRTLRV